MAEGPVRGSVLMQVAGIELLARYSLSSMRHTSVLSSLEDYREQERISVTDKEWNWRILRNQFLQKDLEGLYRRYDDKLMLGYQSVFLILIILISITHVLVIIFTAEVAIESSESLSAIICYSLRGVLSIPLIVVTFSEKIRIRFPFMNLVTSILILAIFILSDVIPSFVANSPPLRPGYIGMTLLACFVFLPIKNNYIAGGLSILISAIQIAVLWTHTYQGDPKIYEKLGADFLFLIGIIFLGVYFRLMSEVLKRRSFLDRRACVEITLRLSYEKEQEDRLLLSILPEHIASVVKNDIREVFVKIQTEETFAVPTKIFNHLYVEEHKNVSILYADVVNYTMITTTLAPRVLVETLNELFGKFDAASVEHDVLRIKFLGDCYYCVSGVPKENVWHAKNCVDLGLEMISIIAELRERKRLDIDMRIGVHSGDITSGLIGIRKWQYDVWSKDVTIANVMESTGKPGKVHITKRTLEELGDFTRNYMIEPNYASRNDPLLSKYGIETFLVTKPPRNSSDYQVTYRRASVGIERWMRKGIQKTRLPDTVNYGAPPVRRRTTGFMETNVESYRQMLKEANIQMKEVIDNMPSGIFGEYFKEETLNPYTLLYRNASWERSFIKQPDPLFKYFIGAGLFILILMMGIQGLTIPTLEPITLIIYGVLFLILLVLQPFSWTQYMWRKFKGSNEPKNFILKFLYEKSIALVWSSTIRSILYIFVSTMMAVTSVVNIIECDITYDDVNNHIVFDENCIDPWHLSQMCTLALMISFLFCRVFFVFKWSVGFILTGLYLWLIWGSNTDLFHEGHSWNHGLDARVAHTMYTVFLFCTLHWTDRQTEYRNRLDHRWKRQLTQEQEEAVTMKLVNNMLLQNILPIHVANIYLNTNRNIDDLYHEEYTNVAVMFASLTDYKLGVDDENELPEKNLLRILDQLISDFDKLLLSENDKRLTVEKIKMAGWTYMAACGLEPGRRTSKVSETSSMKGPIMRSDDLYEDDVVITMIKFATQMMRQLMAFNKSAFQSTNLKIGISHGEVTAGVVGSLKPLYDIWGNAVNMASRMASTGQVGKIQVTENTATVLDRQGIVTHYRGETFVKGAGYINTYFVPFDKNFELILKDDSAVNDSTNL